MRENQYLVGCNHLAVSSLVFDFIGSNHRYLEKQSMTTSIYRKFFFFGCFPRRPPRRGDGGSR